MTGPARSLERGATAIYIALLVSFLILSAAIVLSGTLNVQLRLIQDVVSSERAFYAANSGVEEALYQLVQQNAAGQTGDVTIENGEVPYDERSAHYEVSAKTVIEGNQARACISSLGEDSGDQRRITLGPGELCE